MKSPPRIPRLLLTNDDGIEAPGLSLLAEIAQEFCDEIWVVAPEHDQSGAGQSITLNNSFRCYARGERRWAVAGTPSDCVAMALYHFMKDTKPSLILSGINAGGNSGDEVNLSGTLGAAFTGLMFGVPAIGISQDFTIRKEIRWDTARVIAPKVLRHFLTEGWRKETCLSINIPDLPPEEILGFSWARQGHRNIVSVEVDQREDHRDKSYYWLKLQREKPLISGTDLEVLLGRKEVSVVALGLNRSIDTKEPSVLFDDDGETETDE